MAGDTCARLYHREWLYRLFVLGLLVTPPSLATDQPTVTVEQGLLVGTTETFAESEFIGVNKTIDVFKGVPFAEPPTGELRFKAPVAKRPWPWDGSYDATYFRDACPQSGSSGESEDCLHLNVYAPRPPIPGGAAVMVWIHGGGFTIGSAVEPLYNGIPLVAVGDVILVTINYRLNVFGFLTTGTDDAPGNVGLLDQVLALQWINDNIAAFGGDTDRITIFGESAGAASVSWLLLSEQTAGLYHRAILQSGTSFSPWALNEALAEAKETAFDIGRVVGCSQSDSAALVDCLRSKETVAILSALLYVSVSWAPVIDGVFIDDTPANLYASGRYNHAQILLGTNADEGTFALLFFPQYSNFLTSDVAPTMSKATYTEAISYDMITDYGGTNSQILDAVNMLYTTPSQTDYLWSFVDYYTNAQFACPTNRLALLLAKAGDDVYVYQMTHAPSVSFFSDSEGVGPGWFGASHADDLPFVFGRPFTPEDRGLTDDERALSVKFMEFWTNFAKTGHPGLQTNRTEAESGADYWPRFTVTGLDYKVLALDLTTNTALKREECNAWNNDILPLFDEFEDNGATGLFARGFNGAASVAVMVVFSLFAVCMYI